jgi:Reverse transcriptase (RNA-dependent DNA polymerase)
VLKVPCSCINEELATLKEMGTYELVEPPADVNIVSSKWVFWAKKDAGGTVVHYKGHLVAQGFSQLTILTPLLPLPNLHQSVQSSQWLPI